MCSLDKNRRQHTLSVLKKIHSKAEQLIVLAHDTYFLRDLRDALSKAVKGTPIAVFQLVAALKDYTDFAPLDIDKECESLYSQRHRLLNVYASGSGGDPQFVATAIRPMLEGYLHRRFPGLIPQESMLGQAIGQIRNALTPSPLCHAKNLLDDLNDINDYAKRIHHDDTSSEADTTLITASELKVYVDRALNVVHRGLPSQN